ncbi:glycosyltransferase family 2 protein [Candidatus Gottesmanbacteria bacterium]|nr:glycosyltransferase family 2 protein [Candidatus Gottesmanbacteria bacterium]
MIKVVIVNYYSDKKFPGAVIVNNTNNNRGFAKAVNLGIKKALKMGAEKIILINPDIEISQKDITDLATDDTDITGPVLLSNGVYDYGGKVNWVIGRTAHLKGDPFLEKGSPSEIDYVSGACMVIDKKVFEKIGFFDERFFMYFEDVDFCLRAKQAGFKIAINPKIIIKHELTKNTQKNLYVWESNKKFIDKWIKWYFRPTAFLYLWMLKKLL